MPDETVVGSQVHGVSILPECSGCPSNAPLGRLGMTAYERLKTTAEM